MYEKVMVEHSGVPEGACAFCERPKSIVICSGCRHVVPNVRHRRTCTEHPREFFLMDIQICRNCKGKNLLEYGLDVLSDDLIAAMSPPESPVRPSSSGSGTLSPSPPSQYPARPSYSGSGTLSPSPPSQYPARPSSSGSGFLSPPPTSNNGRVSHASFGLSPIKENSNPVKCSMNVVDPNMASPAPLQQRNVASTPGNLVPGRGRGLKRQRISLSQLQAAANVGNAQGAVAAARVAPVASPISTQASSPAPAPVSAPISVGGGETCICMRLVSFLVCSSCGYYAQGVRKFVPCPVHPQEKKGIKFCPECGAEGDNLDETCF